MSTQRAPPVSDGRHGLGGSNVRCTRFAIVIDNVGAGAADALVAITPDTANEPAAASAATAVVMSFGFLRMISPLVSVDRAVGRAKGQQPPVSEHVVGGLRGRVVGGAWVVGGVGRRVVGGEVGGGLVTGGCVAGGCVAGGLVAGGLIGGGGGGSCSCWRCVVVVSGGAVVVVSPSVVVVSNGTVVAVQSLRTHCGPWRHPGQHGPR
jgi:hypothetical protein